MWLVGFSIGLASVESVPQRGSVWLSLDDLPIGFAMSHTLPRFGTDSIAKARDFYRQSSHLAYVESV